MELRDAKVVQDRERRFRRESENAHRRDLKTPENVGTKTFGSREPGQIFGCEASCLSGCTQRLLGTSRPAKQAKVNT